MTTIELKKSLQNSINSIEDEHFLKAVYAMIKEYLEGEVVGSIGGKPLTRADILERERKADEDIKAGRVHTIDEVKKRLLK